MEPDAHKARRRRALPAQRLHDLTGGATSRLSIGTAMPVRSLRSSGPRARCAPAARSAHAVVSASCRGFARCLRRAPAPTSRPSIRIYPQRDPGIATSEHLLGLLGSSPIPRFLVALRVGLQLRPLSSTGVTRLLWCRVGGGAPARWPPSAAQTARAVFPHAAFTKMLAMKVQAKELTQPDLPAHTRRTAALQATSSSPHSASACTDATGCGA